MKRFPGRPIVAAAILLITIIAFVRYFATHPVVGHQLQRTPLSVALLVLLLYILSIGALGVVTWSTLRLCRVPLGRQESLLLTAYTALVNFFGPLQSGPAFRAVYLKAKYNLKLKNYAAATFIYLFFWGAYSGLMLLSGLLHWWLLGLAIVGAICALLISYHPQLRSRLQGIDLHAWYYLALATLAQVILVTLIYYVELGTIAPGTNFGQAIIYTGAANLALYVSITPAAIGFRESFLVFSRHLHHISNASIVAASILDRALYIVLLLVLAILIFATHAQRRLAVAKQN